MEEIRRIEAKNYNQYRYMKFHAITRTNCILVSRPDDANRRLFCCANSSRVISTNDMVQIISEYLHKIGFDEYEKQGKLAISGKINGENYELQSDEICYI